MLQTDHPRSLPARSFEDLCKIKLWDFYVIFLSKRVIFYIGYYKRGSGSSTSNTSNVVLVVVVSCGSSCSSNVVVVM